MFSFSALRFPTAVFFCVTLLGTSAHAEAPKTNTSSAGPATKALTLSEEQRDRYRDLVRQVMENLKNSRDFHEQLVDLAQSPTYSDKQARSTIQKQQKQAEESLVKTTRALNDFYKTLSPEQRKQVAALREDMKERRKDEMKERAKERRHGDDR